MTNEIIVKIATESCGKREATQRVFSEIYPNLRIDAVKVNSGVSAQPFDEEVFLGAQTRLDNLKKKVKKEKEEYDFLVACEGGIVFFEAFQKYFNVHVCVIENKFGERGVGLSQAYPIPEKYIDEIKRTSLADFFDNKMFNGAGGISMLTEGYVTRIVIVESSIRMALTELKWQ